MKKRLILFICSAIIFTFAGCGDNDSSGRSGNQPAGVNDVLKAGMAEEDNKKTGTESQASESIMDNGNERQSGVNEDAPEPEPVSTAEIPAGSAEGIDVDLTVLSATMVYSEVYNMLVTPENYIGKTVKMDGMYTHYYDEVTGNHYFSCIIADATACCSQGLEFVLDENSYTEADYPAVGEEITLEGTFATYMEDGNQYLTMLNAILL